MADINNTIKTTVELDSNQAQQNIVKLNSKASDSTKTYEERIAAKNKQIEIQNQLSKKTIDSLNEERRTLEGRGASEKELMDIFKKINAEKLKSIKINESNSKALNGLKGASEKAAVAIKEKSEAEKRAASSIGKLDDASGGLITKFKALAASPVGLVILALAGIFQLVSTAIGRSEEASKSFEKVGAKLSGLFNGLIAFITPVVEILGKTLVFAIEKPEKAWQSFVDTLEQGYNFIKAQVVDRFEGNFKQLSGNFEANILRMRIAWNEFTGDSEEAQELTKELDIAINKVKEGTEQIANANKAIVDVVKGVVDTISEAVDVAIEKGKIASAATEALANSERSLVKNRIALEKQQLKSLALAEEERQARDDTTKSIEERLAANTRLGKILDEQSEKELQIAGQNLNFARLQAKATGDTIENIQSIGDAEIKLLEIRERITGQRSEQLVSENGLLTEQTAKVEELALRELEAQDKLDALKIARIKANGESSLEAELEILETKRLRELENLELTELGKREIEERFKSERQEILKADEEKKAEQELVKNEALLELEEIELERLREKDTLTLERELAFLEKRRLQEVANVSLTAEEIAVINARSEDAKAKIRKSSEEAEAAKEKVVLDNAINGAVEAFGISQEVAVAKMIMAAPQAVAGSFKEASLAYAPPLSLAMGALGAAGTLIPIVKGLADIKKTRFSKSKGGAKGGSINTAISSGGSSAISAAAKSVTPEVISDLSSNNSARLGVDTAIGSNASNDASNNVRGGTSSNIVFSEARYADFRNQVQFKEEKFTI